MMIFVVARRATCVQLPVPVRASICFIILSCLCLYLLYHIICLLGVSRETAGTCARVSFFCFFEQRVLFCVLVCRASRGKLRALVQDMLVVFFYEWRLVVDYFCCSRLNGRLAGNCGYLFVPPFGLSYYLVCASICCIILFACRASRGKLRIPVHKVFFC